MRDVSFLLLLTVKVSAERKKAKKEPGSALESSDSRAAASGKDYCSKTAISSSLICEAYFLTVMLPSRRRGAIQFAGQNKFRDKER